MEAGQIIEGDLITVPELAKILKVSPGTLYNKLGRLGPLDGVVRDGSHYTRIIKAVYLARLMAGKLGSKS